MKALSWEKRSLRLAIAIDSFIYFANVKPDHKYAFYGNTLAFVSGTETVTFWDTVTHQVSAYFIRHFRSRINQTQKISPLLSFVQPIFKSK